MELVTQTVGGRLIYRREWIQRIPPHRQCGCSATVFSRLLVILLLVFSANALAQTSEDIEKKPVRLFSTSNTLDVTLTLPWQAIVVDEFFFQGTYPASVEFTDDLGKVNSLELTTERRGMTRQVVCRYPPIKLRFHKEVVKDTVFHGQKSLKLATHCDTDAPFERYQVLEILAYKMYNLITDFSFRIRPLSVTYIDSENGGSDGPRLAFLIEDDGDVAKRNGQKKLKSGEITPEKLHPQESGNLSLFQYMIGNTDWAVNSGFDPENCCKNIKLVGQDPDSDPIYAIPNDFDSSGLVNAHYAVPPADLPINSVTQRLYRGYCVHNEALADAKQRFLAREQDIYSLLEKEDRLSDDSKKEAGKYLEKFFEVLRDQAKFEREIIANCRN
jgi:hypothetical protein